MPWCDGCAKYWSPPSARGGQCPACGGPLDTGEPPDEVGAGAPATAEPGVERGRAPWHFKLLLVATVLYLGFRTYQGVVWVTHHL